jgi:hypothetical protein
MCDVLSSEGLQKARFCTNTATGKALFKSTSKQVSISNVLLELESQDSDMLRFSGLKQISK